MNFLAADIGGTKTLIGIYKFEEEIKLIFKSKYKSSDWKSFNMILQDFIDRLPSSLNHPKVGCIGIAGPLEKDKVKVTNLDWEIDSNEIQKISKCKIIDISNDFSCLIYGIPFLKESQFSRIQNPNGTYETENQNSLFTVIGAGTGLGIGRGLLTSKGLDVFASEGGHKEFAPRTQNEWDLSKWLKCKLGSNRLSIEEVVSGRGLGNIALWLLEQKDFDSHPLRQICFATDFKTENLPELVSNYAKRSDPLMKQALEMWLSAYGSVAGDLALHELCYAGLWIAGGTAAKHLEGLQSEIFLKALKNKGSFSEFLEKIPIIAITDPDAGLFGAACKAHVISKNQNIECQTFPNSKK